MMRRDKTLKVCANHASMYMFYLYADTIEAGG